jgi:hypothetical protein
VLTEQSSGLAEEMVGGLRTRTETLDDAAERKVRGWLRRPRPARGMSVPRSRTPASRRAPSALAIDAVLSQGIFLVGAALLGLAARSLGELRPAWLVAFLAPPGWVLTGTVYFAGFWGRDRPDAGHAAHAPARRRARRRAAAPRPAVVRVVGLVARDRPGLRRVHPGPGRRPPRGLPDFLAGTVVVYAGASSPRARLEPDVSLATRDMSGQPS